MRERERERERKVNKLNSVASGPNITKIISTNKSKLRNP